MEIDTDATIVLTISLLVIGLNFIFIGSMGVLMCGRFGCCGLGSPGHFEIENKPHEADPVDQLELVILQARCSESDVE